MFSIILQATRIGPPVLGILLPAFILGLSFVLTYLLVRYFSKNNKLDD